MREFMILGLLGFIMVNSTVAEYYPVTAQLMQDDAYAPVASEYQTTEKVVVIPETEYYSFSAPENFDDNNDVQRLTTIVRPQRVVFIRTPEKNIFSLTAEQLAKKDSLNIYLLRRDTNAAGLLSQLDEIRQSVGQKPNVHFVKYRTPEDIERAKQAIYSEYESLPGPSLYHENTRSPVHKFNSNSPLYEENYTSGDDSTSPVIFRIIRRASPIQPEEIANSHYEEEYLPHLPNDS